MAPKVLIAEDDASVRMTLEMLLGVEGFDLIVASDGVEALALAKEQLPDVILLDQVMPRMDGRQVFFALREEESTADIPVLVLSGMARETIEGWPGAYFVGKPFSPDVLLEQIRSVIA